jgi:hypothetical protein
MDAQPTGKMSPKPARARSGRCRVEEVRGSQSEVTGGGHGGHRKVQEHHEVVKNDGQVDVAGVVEAALKHLNAVAASA